jgi:hypothetical protein
MIRHSRKFARFVLVALMALAPTLPVRAADNTNTGIIFHVSAVPVPVELIALGEGAAQSGQGSIAHKLTYVAFPSAARTSSVNSSAFPLYDADKLVLYVSCTAASGTSPTLDVKIQDSPDFGTTWFDVAGTAITTITAAGTQITSATRAFNKTGRVVVAIGGTTPSFTFSVFYMAVTTTQA